MTFEEIIRHNIVEQERRESSDLEQLYLELPIPMDVINSELNVDRPDRGYTEIDMG